MPDFIILVIGAVVAVGVVTVILGGLLARTAQRQAEAMAAQAIKSCAAVEARLAEVAKAIRNLPYEISVFIDPVGEIVFKETQHDAKAVRFSNAQIGYLQQNPRHINIHNHNTDTPPSIQDLFFSAQVKAAYFVVVTPHYTYTVYPRPVSGWASEAELNEAVNKFQPLFKLVGMKFDNEIVETLPDGSVISADTLEYECTDEAIESVTQYLGYRYDREPVA